VESPVRWQLIRLGDGITVAWAVAAVECLMSLLMRGKIACETISRDSCHTSLCLWCYCVAEQLVAGATGAKYTVCSDDTERSSSGSAIES
jgi:hypothetical protein